MKAEELAQPDVPRFLPGATAKDARTSLAGERFCAATDIAVCENGTLLGVVPVERLFGADPEAELLTLSEEPVVVAAADDSESVALLAADGRRRTAAVVDGGGEFVGLVPPERLLAVLRLEHDEDMARLVGVRSAATQARAASEERVVRRLWHRFPWLAVGLAGAMLSAVVVGAFEDSLRKELLLALFVPAVVYMADAVGTQTEAIVIRGLAVGVPIGRVFRRELGAGLLIGASVGLLFFPFVLLAWGDVRVAGTAAIALFVSASIATVVAMGLPYALARAGRDPAFGSGPLATVVQDLLSIIVYFAVAALLVQ